jgi:hypothetical protein
MAPFKLFRLGQGSTSRSTSQETEPDQPANLVITTTSLNKLTTVMTSSSAHYLNVDESDQTSENSSLMSINNDQRALLSSGSTADQIGNEKKTSLNSLFLPRSEKSLVSVPFIILELSFCSLFLASCRSDLVFYKHFNLVLRVQKLLLSSHSKGKLFSLSLSSTLKLFISLNVKSLKGIFLSFLLFKFLNSARQQLLLVEKFERKFFPSSLSFSKNYSAKRRKNFFSFLHV